MLETVRLRVLSVFVCVCLSVSQSFSLTVPFDGSVYGAVSVWVALGVTQEMIDDIRLSTENKMLSDLKQLHQKGGDLDHAGSNGETPVEKCFVILF